MKYLYSCIQAPKYRRLESDMPTIVDVLQREPKEMRPEWLYAHTTPRFNRNAFFKSRTIYYPGSGDDGQPVKLSALSHIANAFVYVDQNYRWNTLAERLVDKERGFRGYKLVHDENVSKSQLRLGDWKKHIKREETERSICSQPSFVKPFARFTVQERLGDDKDHGPWRIAILFIGGDGFASFDALYCQENDTPPPFLIVIQDHGSGGSYSRFDRGGCLERIACRNGMLPKFLLVARNSEPWSSYVDTGAVAEPGGCHAHPRSLFRRK